MQIEIISLCIDDFNNTFVWYILEWFSMCAYSYIRTKIDFPSKSSSTVPTVLFSYLLVFMHLTDLVSIGINVFQQISNMKNTPNRILPIRRKTLNNQSINHASAAFLTDVQHAINMFYFILFFQSKEFPTPIGSVSLWSTKSPPYCASRWDRPRAPRSECPVSGLAEDYPKTCSNIFFFWLLTNF